MAVDVTGRLCTPTAIILPAPRAAPSPACTHHAMADALLKANGPHRPGNVKHPSAPSLMMNAHLPRVGEDAPQEAYEHGIQVVDEDKVFKYVCPRREEVEDGCCGCGGGGGCP